MKKIESRLVRQNITLFFVLLILAVIALILNLNINKLNSSISNEEHNRELAFRVVDELRQSSDDLTRMARLYVVTGDSNYLQYFNEIPRRTPRHIIDDFILISR